MRPPRTLMAHPRKPSVRNITRWVCAYEICVLRRGKLLDEFNIRLRVAVEVERRLAFDLPGIRRRSSTAAHIFRLRVGDSLVVSLRAMWSNAKKYKTLSGHGLR